MKLVLFAVTGFGNEVLDALLAENCEVAYLFTRPGREPSPYYPGTENLITYAEKSGVPIHDDFDWIEIEKKIKMASPELLLVATYPKIIPSEIIKAVPLAVNIHPSLLPKYRGATPIDWVLYNKEKETGVTAHLLAEKADRGGILIQKKIKIAVDDSKATLTRKLIDLYVLAVRELIKRIKAKSLKPELQNEKEATYFPRFDKLSEEEKIKLKLQNDDKIRD
ncbi:MAG: formyltransferase family protein [Patescibacteria group bacterium]|nr:formyltransferase family protein [Patescibacteria group bacterium]